MLKRPDIDRLKIAAMAAVLGLVAACSGENTATPASIDPVAFETGDECHLCGMVITAFPGPKGQLFEGRDNSVRKFCSTRDLMSWYLQPENRPNSRTLFVHDMSRSDWNSPSDAHLIDARSAWFVVGSKLRGSMGPTLASFARKTQAEAFAALQGGKLLTFDEVTLDILNMSNPVNWPKEG